MITHKLLYQGDNLEDCFEVRTKVFVEEQGFSAEIEIDDIDDFATHVIFFDDGKPIATGRTFPNAENIAEYVLGRIAVLKEYRGTGLGLEIMHALEEAAKQKGAATAILGAQRRAEKFYEKCGYEAYGEEYFEEYCPHIHMRKSI